jgi:DNA repair protein RecO (recombination protein O)
MSTEKTEGLVIRQADFSETSRVVTFFTRDFGKVSTIAKGARRLKGPFEAALDLLTVCRIVFLRKSSASLDILTEAQLVSRFKPHGRDLVSLYGGYLVAELLSSLTEEYDPHPELYDEAVATLRRLSAGPRPREAVLRFALVALREIGQLPATDACVACGKPVAGDQGYAFWVSQGGLLCAGCRRSEFQSHEVSAGSVAVIRRLASEPHDVLDRIVISQQQQQEIQRLAMAAISHVLGHRPRMFRYLQP